MDVRGGMPRSEVQQPQLDGLYPSGQVQLTARSIPEHSQAVRPRSSALLKGRGVDLCSSANFLTRSAELSNVGLG